MKIFKVFVLMLFLMVILTYPASATPVMDTMTERVENEKVATVTADSPVFSFYTIMYQDTGESIYGKNMFTLSTHTEIDPETYGLISTPFKFIRLQPTRVWVDADYRADAGGSKNEVLDYELVAEGTVDFIPEWFKWRLSKKAEININDWGFGVGFAYENLWLGYLKNNAGNDRVNLSGYVLLNDVYAFVDASYVTDDERIDGEAGLIFPIMDVFGGSKPVIRVLNIYNEWIFSLGILIEWG